MGAATDNRPISCRSFAGQCRPAYVPGVDPVAGYLTGLRVEAQQQGALTRLALVAPGVIDSGEWTPSTGVTMTVDGDSSGLPVFGSCRVFAPLHWPATAVRASAGFTARFLFAWTGSLRVTRAWSRDEANPRKRPASHLWTWGYGACPMRVHESRAGPRTTRSTLTWEIPDNLRHGRQ